MAFGLKKARIEDLETTCSAYAQELNDLRARVQEKQNEITRRDSEIAELTGQAERLGLEKFEQSNQMAEMLGNLKGLERQVTTQKTLAEHNQKAARELETYKQGISEGEQICNEQMGEIIKLNDELVETRAKLVTAHGQIEDLAYENDDLNRMVELYASVLSVLRVPVKLTVRKRGSR